LRPALVAGLRMSGASNGLCCHRNIVPLHWQKPAI
jgi:hypothetical protein